MRPQAFGPNDPVDDVCKAQMTITTETTFLRELDKKLWTAADNLCTNREASVNTRHVQRFTGSHPQTEVQSAGPLIPHGTTALFATRSTTTASSSACGPIHGTRLSSQ